MSIRVYGNRSLKTLSGQETRPTSSRVRESVFNIWRDRLQDCRWLDLCAGVGAMGAEALARGAASVVGVERSKVACQVVRQNWQKVASGDQQFKVIRGDVSRLSGLKKLAPFDCIYFDPPYAAKLYLPVLEQVEALGLLARGGEMVAEHASDNEELPEMLGELVLCDRRRYGYTSLSFYRHGDAK